MARFLQDVSDDDARSAGFGDLTWVVRRTVVAVHSFPRFGEVLTSRTWCSGFGAAWAERRISLLGDGAGHVESATLWVSLDPTSMRPARMTAEFLAVFGPSAAGRAVSSKPLLDAPPAGVAGSPWSLRFTDFDVLEHVNNAIYWAPVEQQLAVRRDLRAPLTAVVEHGDAIERGDTVTWLVRDRDDGFDGWLLGDEGRRYASMRVSEGV